MTNPTPNNDTSEPESTREALIAAAADIGRQAARDGVDLTSSDGLLNVLMKNALEAAMNAEMTDHLGYEKHAKTGANTGNSRNGSHPVTVDSVAGPVTLDRPRDRTGEFDSVIVPKGTQTMGGVDDMILSLYAKGMTTRDIAEHLHTTYGTDISHEKVSTIVEAIDTTVKQWRNRPLDEVYPIVYLDAIWCKVKESGRVVKKACHVALGVDLDGTKSVLGLWLHGAEGASAWAAALTELHNRGVQDVFIVCCDGLPGLPGAVTATWPHATVQTCVVHLIRNSLRYASYKDRKVITGYLKPMYTAATVEAAQLALDEFEASEVGQRCPAAVAAWKAAWERFVPFLEFPAAIRKVVYTTNAIESLNYQLRKVTKTRGHFPDDQAAYRLLYLAITDIENRKTGRGKTKRAPGILDRGRPTHHWHEALNHLALLYPDRLPLSL